MFYVDIGGLRALYTGDYSRTRTDICRRDSPSAGDAARRSTLPPHSPREERERRFTDRVHQILNRGGKVLLPVVALGRAQELLLILEDYWVKHPELRGVPIYQASALARRAMTVYQTYINVLNSDMKAAFEEANPFVFNHVNHLSSANGLDDVGPCVVLATPSMLQSGLSRELFEAWCGDANNGVIIADFAVQGTLAREILSDCKSIQSRSGGELPLKMSVDAIFLLRARGLPADAAVPGRARAAARGACARRGGRDGQLKRALEGKAAADGKKMHGTRPRTARRWRSSTRLEDREGAGRARREPARARATACAACSCARTRAHARGARGLAEYTKLATAAVTQRQMIPTETPLTDLRFALEALFEGSTP